MNDNKPILSNQQPNQEMAQVGRQPTLGGIANQMASAQAFYDYTIRKSKNTLRAHLADLILFSNFLIEYDGRLSQETGTSQWAGLEPTFLANSLQSSHLHWQGITWGLVDLFKSYLLNDGRAIASINRAISTAKVYAMLAHKAGGIPAEEYLLIKTITGYSQRDKKRVDEKRAVTRVGHKKEHHTVLTLEQARQLKWQNFEKAQGCRDALITAIFLDLGLRLGEVAILKVADFDLANEKMTVYRPKVNKTQIFQMTADVVRAYRAYRPYLPSAGVIWRNSNKNGELINRRMSERAISKRIEYIGSGIGLYTLSPHDLRHYWATNAAQSGTGAFDLRDAGGWNSMAMPSRYVDERTVANEGIKLKT